MATTPLTREQMRAVYKLFEYFALDDQRSYYMTTIQRYRSAAREVSRWRAALALLTGLSSAVVGLLVATYSNQCFVGGNIGTDCGTVHVVVIVMLVIAVVAPAFASAFTTLADLYQWDRLIAIYESALENLDVADAQSPDDEMDDENYFRALQIYTEGTLSVMNDETAQWGQLIKPPQVLTEFVQGAGETIGDGGLSGITGIPTIPVDSD